MLPGVIVFNKLNLFFFVDFDFIYYKFNII